MMVYSRHIPYNNHVPSLARAAGRSKEQVTDNRQKYSLSRDSSEKSYWYHIQSQCPARALKTSRQRPVRGSLIVTRNATELVLYCTVIFVFYVKLQLKLMKIDGGDSRAASGLLVQPHSITPTIQGRSAQRKDCLGRAEQLQLTSEFLPLSSRLANLLQKCDTKSEKFSPDFHPLAAAQFSLECDTFWPSLRKYEKFTEEFDCERCSLKLRFFLTSPVFFFFCFWQSSTPPTILDRKSSILTSPRVLS